MSRKTRRAGRGPDPARPAGRRRWLGWGAVGGGIALALLVCVLICLRVVSDAARHDPGQVDHDHPPGPHGGAFVAVGRENRYHVEAVFERTGQVRVYTYGDDETRIHPIDSRPVPATVRRAVGTTEFSVLLSPEPRPGDPPGKASRFVGRLPRELGDGPVELVVSAMEFGDGRHWFAVKSGGDWHPDPMPEGVTVEEGRKLYLTAGGAYTEADIKQNGGAPASERFRGIKADHDANPRPGDRVCPISRTKADPRFTWVVGGREYQFCCPPCIDEFVRKAKEKPDQVKQPENYVQPP